MYVSIIKAVPQKNEVPNTLYRLHPCLPQKHPEKTPQIVIGSYPNTTITVTTATTATTTIYRHHYCYCYLDCLRYFFA